MYGLLSHMTQQANDCRYVARQGRGVGSMKHEGLILIKLLMFVYCVSHNGLLQKLWFKYLQQPI